MRHVHTQKLAQLGFNLILVEWMAKPYIMIHELVFVFTT